ncbi:MULTISPECIES: type II secretion system minor pseudopilin GspI [unclassified Moraxella]|uniref:type II secretion system minor pseudopilin GspI n=1 Tax=unclassified Moraxella TaxID=2685852 RepID=UPI003AF6B60A
MNHVIAKHFANLPNQQRGFTLIEVMVALAILAVVAVSASQASRSYVQSVGNMKQRSLAYFVAQNTLADLRIQQTWLTASETRQAQMGGQAWQVTIAPSELVGLGSDTLKKVEIQVAPVTQGNVGHSIVSLEGTIRKMDNQH